MKPYSVSATNAMGVVEMNTPAMGMKEQMNTNSDRRPMPEDGAMVTVLGSTASDCPSCMRALAAGQHLQVTAAASGLKAPAAPGICIAHMPSAVSPVLASAMRACNGQSEDELTGHCRIAACRGDFLSGQAGQDVRQPQQCPPANEQHVNKECCSVPGCRWDCPTIWTVTHGNSTLK